MKKLFTLLLSIAFYTSFSQTTHLVMSQVYGGGGNSGAQYTNDFIEIFNPTQSTVVMTNWSIQYSPATGTWAGQTTTGAAISGTIAPGKYFLVQLAAGAGTSGSLPTPDFIPTTYLNGVTGTINMSATGGKIALVSNLTVLGTTGTGCPTGAVVDFLGYGTANCGEGTVLGALSNTTAALRRNGGCQDNDNNSGDFTIVAPAPRNSTTAVNLCVNNSPTISASPSTLTLTSNVGTASAPQTFSASAINIFPPTDPITITPSANLEISLDGVNYFPGVNVNCTAGTLASTTIYVRIKASAPNGALLTDSVKLSQSGAPTISVQVNGGVSQNYYTKPSGNLDVLSTWGTNTDGSGTSPTDFTTPYQNFTVTQTTATIGTNWDPSGQGSRVIIGNGTTATTVTVPSTAFITAGSFINLSNFGTLVLMNNVRPFLNTLANGSLVDFAETGLTSADTIKIPAVSYFNLKLTNGLKYFSANTTTVRGDLTVDGAKGLNGPNLSPFATINAFGNVTYMNGANFDINPAGDPGRLTLKMNGAGASQTISGSGINLLIFRLERDSTSACNIILTPGTNLVLGNNSSGGLLLAPATATLLTGAGSTISLIGGALFTTTSLGKINSTNTNISILKSLTAVNAGIMRFVSGSTLNNLLINFDPAFARDSVTIADSVSILGTLTLTKGKVLTTSPAVIMMQSAAVLNGGSAASYVDGKISKTGTTAFTFPVGKAGKYAPIQLSNNPTLNTYTAQCVNAGYGTYTINPTTLTNYPAYAVSTAEYWTLTRATAVDAPTLVFPWDAASGITTPTLEHMATFGGTDWSDAGGSSSGTNTAGTVTVNAASSFGPFTFAYAGSGIGDYYRTIATGNFNAPTTWESSPVADFSSGLVSPATVSPDFHAAAITIRTGHTVTVTANVTVINTTINPGGNVIVNTGVTMTTK